MKRLLARLAEWRFERRTLRMILRQLRTHKLETALIRQSVVPTGSSGGWRTIEPSGAVEIVLKLQRRA